MKKPAPWRCVVPVILAGFILSCAPQETVQSNSVGVFAATASHREPALRELAWLSEDADVVSHLTSSPGECLRPAQDADAAYLVEIGRVAFRSPFLFGGPAARGGLSCESCHLDGHDNPSFFLSGLSGTPGTADVTSSILSKTRDDGVFNPLPIPSLIGIGGKETFGTQSPASTLRDFILSAVVDEFQGAPPPDRIVDGLATYIAHLDPKACPEIPVDRTVARDLGGVSVAVNLAADAIAKEDFQTADFLILSAQNLLGAVHERYVAESLLEDRDKISAAAGELRNARATLIADPVGAIDQLKQMEGGIRALEAHLSVGEAASFYNRATLSAALGQSSD